MDAAVRAQFTDDVQAAVAVAAGVDPGTMGKPLGFESFVHRAEREGATVYVKSTWSGRRTAAQIHAELAFVGHLAEGGVPIARALPLVDGALLAELPTEGGAFRVCVFEEAPGVCVQEPGTLTEDHLVAWGRLLGQMHRLAQDEACDAWVAARPTWKAEHDALRIHATDPRVAARYDALLTAVAALPRDREVFGLIHSDPHQGNVHWVGTAPTIFDFDDCLGFWFASDLAMVLYYALDRHVPLAERPAVHPGYLHALRQGYDAVFSLPEEAWASLQLFMDLRDAVLWLVCMRSYGDQPWSDAFRTWMDGLHTRMVDGQHAHGLPGDSR